MFGAESRKKRVGQLRASRSRWHLDEVFVGIDAVQHDLWRAVGHKGSHPNDGQAEGGVQAD